ncbi:MAG: hypothetical protein ABSB96_07450 [Gaiellaceae bacterium]
MAPAASKHPANVFRSYRAVITGFKITAEEKWGFSVTNQSNNSGWMTATGDVTWAASLNKAYLPAKRRFNLYLRVEGGGSKLWPTTIVIPVHQPHYTIDTEGATEQWGSESCSGGGELGLDDPPELFLTVESGPKKNGHSTLAIIWPDFSVMTLGHSKCGSGPHPISDTSNKRFESVTPMAELTSHNTVTLHGGGVIPVVPTSTEDCFGCIGFKGSGSYTWEASITLRETV